MKNTNLKRYLPLIGIVALALICTVIILVIKINPSKKAGSIAKYDNVTDKVANIASLSSYVPENSKKSLAKLKETGDIYFYSAEGLRYIFPNNDIYKSWFGDYVPVREETIEQMSKSRLKGAVSLKPGTLTMTESDPKIYLVGNHSTIYSLTPALLSELFGMDWQKKIVNLPNWFFAYYIQAGSIEVTGALPDFPSKPILEDNLIIK
jgi:hypothetical protein